MSHTPEFTTLSEQAKTIHPGDRYRHFKGDEYVVVGVGKHTETLEEFVVYRLVDQSDDVLCIRPLALFLDHVDRATYHGPRFTLLKTNLQPYTLRVTPGGCKIS